MLKLLQRRKRKKKKKKTSTDAEKVNTEAKVELKKEEIRPQSNNVEGTVPKKKKKKKKKKKTTIDNTTAVKENK